MHLKFGVTKLVSTPFVIPVTAIFFYAFLVVLFFNPFFATDRHIKIHGMKGRFLKRTYSSIKQIFIFHTLFRKSRHRGVNKLSSEKVIVIN